MKLLNLVAAGVLAAVTLGGAYAADDAALAYVSAFVEEAKASGMVRRSLDSLGMQSSVVALASKKP